MDATTSDRSLALCSALDMPARLPCSALATFAFLLCTARLLSCRSPRSFAMHRFPAAPQAIVPGCFFAIMFVVMPIVVQKVAIHNLLGHKVALLP